MTKKKLNRDGEKIEKLVFELAERFLATPDIAGGRHPLCATPKRRRIGRGREAYDWHDPSHEFVPR